MEFFNTASVVLKYFMQANIIVTFCIILVFAVRFLVRKYSRLFSCCAWGIVGFGLVYFIVSPLQFPFRAICSFLSEKSGLSYTPIFDDAIEPPAASGGTAAGNVVSEPPALPRGEGMTGGDLSGEFTVLSPDFPQMQISGITEWTQDIRFAQIFSFVWLAGILIFLIHFFYSYIRIKRQTRFAIRLRENIFEMDGCISPFVYGLFPVRIYLPYGLNEAERSLIIAHERCHIKYGHPVILLLAEWIRILFWINPLVWIACRKLRFDLEMFCDEYTTKKFSMPEKKMYALLLVQMAFAGKMTNVVSFSSGASVLKNRIKNILESKKGNIALPVCLLILCLLIVAAGTSYAAGNSDLTSDQSNSGNGNGKTENAVASPKDVDQKRTELGLQDSEIDPAIPDESGKISAEQGNLHEEAFTGAGSLTAADTIKDGTGTQESAEKENSDEERENILPSDSSDSSDPMETSGSVAYENRDLGFRIEFPDNWENRYSVAANPNSSSGVIIEMEYGTLGFVFKTTAKEWEESVTNDLIPVPYTVLGENDEYVYVVYLTGDFNTGDFNLDLKDEKIREKFRIYQEMREDLHRIGFEIL